MEPRRNAITLAVDDLERAVRFYRDGLGLPTDGIFGTEFAGSDDGAAGAIAMFTLAGGTILSVYPRTELAKDGGVEPSGVGGPAVSLGHVVDSRDEVHRVLAEAERAGATITAVPAERPWGVYCGYFRDPDGHLWEILHFLPNGPAEDPGRPS
ncbi:MAG: VOC family protein [Actinomycetota bacterium]|nr:VOC family protein [Actinomycetota bacterium]